MFDRPDRPQRLGLCANGHVTDPDVDIDIRTGTPITSHAWDVLRHRVLGDLERGSDAWTQLCRAVVRRSSQLSPHACRAQVTPLANYPDLEAAYRLGGAPAVAAAIDEQNRARRTRGPA
jgi:hypothetical protein